MSYREIKINERRVNRNVFSRFLFHENIQSGRRENALDKLLRNARLLGTNFRVLRPKY
ncbi:MAG: hypothetical protein WCW25_01495 [Patescibacteria group bacterium]